MADKNKLGLMGWMKLPAAFLAGGTGIVTVLVVLGFGFSSPADRWEEHEVEHVVEMEVHQEELAKIDVALDKFDDMQMEQQTLVESIVRGECIENPIENLQRQGLIQKCEELGIER